MIWESIAATLRVALLGWLIVVASAILWQVMTGRILITGMTSKTSEDSFSFHRLQLASVSLLFAAGYVITALGRAPGAGLPDIATPVLAAIFASHATYLGGKFLS